MWARRRRIETLLGLALGGVVCNSVFFPQVTLSIVMAGTGPRLSGSGQQALLSQPSWSAKADHPRVCPPQAVHFGPLSSIFLKRSGPKTGMLGTSPSTTRMVATFGKFVPRQAARQQQCRWLGRFSVRHELRTGQPWACSEHPCLCLRYATNNRQKGRTLGLQTRGWSAFADHDGIKSEACRPEPDSRGTSPAMARRQPQLDSGSTALHQSCGNHCRRYWAQQIPHATNGGSAP
jgi:hypothetical protein